MLINDDSLYRTQFELSLSCFGLIVFCVHLIFVYRPRPFSFYPDQYKWWFDFPLVNSILLFNLTVCTGAWSWVDEVVVSHFLDRLFVAVSIDEDITTHFSLIALQRLFIIPRHDLVSVDDPKPDSFDLQFLLGGERLILCLKNQLRHHSLLWLL